MTVRTPRQLMAMAAICAMGLPAAAMAQESRTGQRDQREAQQDRRDHQAAAMQLMRSSDILGDTVMLVKTEDGKTAEINDLIINTRTGRAPYAVIGSGGLLGIGERQSVIRFDRLAYDPSEKNWRLDMTRAQLEQAPEFEVISWRNVDQDQWLEDVGRSLGEDPGRRAERSDADLYTPHFANGKFTTVTGEIRSVTRWRPEEAEHTYTMVTLNDANGAERRVIIAPVWWMQDRGLKDGQVVTIVAVPANDRTGQMWAARTVTLSDGKVMTIRDETGRPAWTARDVGTRRFALASDLDDGDIIGTDGETIGEVSDLVIDRTSGRAKFALASVGGVLGVGAETYAVPFDALTPTAEGQWLIGMTAQEFKTAPTLKDGDISTLSSRVVCDSLDQHYSVNGMMKEKKSKSTGEPDRRREGQSPR